MLNAHSGCVEMTLALIGMVRLDQKPDIHILCFVCELKKFRACGPGEVMYILGMVKVCGRAIIIIANFNFDARGSNDILFGHGDADIVHTEIGEELRIGMELMTVPAFIRVNTNFRKPLAHEEIFLFCARSCKRRRRQLGGEIDIHGHKLTPRQRFRQRHAKHRFVVFISVIGLNVLQAIREVGGIAHDFGSIAWMNVLDTGTQICSIGNGEPIHVIKSPAILIDFVTATQATGFSHKCGFAVAKRVQVHVKTQFRYGVVGFVVPNQYFGTVQQTSVRVQLDLDVVICNAWTKRIREKRWNVLGN